MTEAAPSSPAPRAHLLVADRRLQDLVGEWGYALATDVAAADAVVATTVYAAEAAAAAGRPALLWLGAPGAAAHLEAGPAVEGLFDGPAALRERLEWLHGRGWRAPTVAPRRVDLAAQLVAARGWLNEIRAAECAAQVAHDAAVAQRTAHERALTDHRDHLLERLAELDGRLAETDRRRHDAEVELARLRRNPLARLGQRLEGLARAAARTVRGGRR